MEPLIITVAGVGAELTRDQQPNLPITPDEIAADARECRDAGASIYHLHVRDRNGNPTMDIGAFKAATEAIADATDLIVQFTTGGAVSDDEKARIAPLDLRPEMASLTTGTVNFGESVFLNPLWLIVALYRRMRANSILPEFEIFEPGMIATAERLYAEHGDGHHRHFDFVLGVPGGMPAWGDSVEFLARHLPDGATWGATGIGASNLRVAEGAIGLGGHVRTGFEDVRWFERGVLATSNSQLVERVADIAERSGRRVGTPAEARSLLGLKR